MNLISLKGNGDEDILDDLDTAQTMNDFLRLYLQMRL